MEEDLNHLSAAIIASLDKINRILGTGRLESKLLTTPGLPSYLLKLSQQDWVPTTDASTADPSNRLSAEDVDALFAKIRTRSAGASTPAAQPPPSKKPIPLQQSRILNETNLVNGQSGSFTDLSESGKLLSLKNFDVGALVKSLQQSAEALGRIENRRLESVDFQRVERYNQRECAKIRDGVKDVEVMVRDLEKYVVGERGAEDEKKELISGALVGKLRELSETMSQVIFIKNNEYIPEISKSLVLGSLPLAECLDDVNENIRQKKLYQ